MIHSLRAVHSLILGCLLTTGLLLSPHAAAAATTAQSHGVRSQHAHPPYALLQMNICSSGYAGCYPGTEYPKILDEVVARIEANHVNAVTLNEACSGDVAEIAARTGFHYRFATVIYNGPRCPASRLKEEASSAMPC
ncbi:hypothetical protein MBT84_48735 [Streptomyces sp. MBT84]|uniref:hypothetical protein n=1 Tax=Streptomyces sp. MBT84 TaxID=1488414 RepID=UPI001C6EAAF6|nr:hypothetical protein [Streptomyces sp. MBT84]MBW8707550.1 hypothetical protein [Streptomyces sp. MBT84]